MESREGPSRRAAVEPRFWSSSPPVDAAGPGTATSAQPGAGGGGRKRKGAAAAVANPKPRQPQVYKKDHTHVYYGHRKEFREVHQTDLDGCQHLIAQLPLQPHLMSLVDLQLWVIRLFQLHPETQDLSIKGFFLVSYPSDFYPERDCWYWSTYNLTCNEAWVSFAKKVKGRNGMPMFGLYVDSSEIKHYKSLLKAIPDDYSQLGTVVLPEQKCMSTFFPLNSISKGLTEDLTITTTEVAAYLESAELAAQEQFYFMDPSYFAVQEAANAEESDDEDEDDS